LLAAIFLTSFSLIAFEITLSRLLSVLLSYHYVFVVLSLALLGLGFGGLFVHFFRPPITNELKRFSSLAFLAALFSLTIPFSAILIIQAGYVEDLRLNILFYCFLLFIPFFFAGVLFAEVYRMLPAMSARIYGLDLMGAAAGSLGVIQVLNILGGINTNFLLGVAASIAALLFAAEGWKENKRGFILPIFSVLITSLLLGITLSGSFRQEIPIGINSTKEIHDALYEPSFKGEIIETKWSAFGRTDLVQYKNFPDHMDIYLDGTAGSPMYRFSGNLDDPGSTISNLKGTFPGYFPFLELPEERRKNGLIIGPGGGRDILLALMGGVRKITAVEVNKDLVEIVCRHSRFNGGIYTDIKNVQIIVDEGRNFLKRQKEKYDLIMLSLPVTNTSRSLEGYALTENFLFTTDSIGDYLEHLTGEGRLVVVGHDDVEILRLLSISLAALEERGVGNQKAMDQIYIVGSNDYLVFVLKKTPFEPKEALLGFETMHQLGYDPALSYFPYIRKMGALNPALMALGSGKIDHQGLEKMLSERGYDIHPVTDNRPFFYKFEKGIPQPVSLIFWASIILLLLTVWIPPLYWRKGPISTEGRSENKRSFDEKRLKPVVLFSMLGVGFMLIEISLIQRFVFFLGEPVLSLAVSLFSLLGGAGLGSLWSGRLPSDQLTKWIARISLTIAGMVLIYIFILPAILDQLLGLDLTIRLCITVCLLSPIAFLVGCPFPLGIRLLKERGLEKHIPWMWGINGLSSVVGSAMTIVVAISFGFAEALLISAGCYFIVFFIFRKS